jgi:hypothetical protein
MWGWFPWAWCKELHSCDLRHYEACTPPLCKTLILTTVSLRPCSPAAFLCQLLCLAHSPSRLHILLSLPHRPHCLPRAPGGSLSLLLFQQLKTPNHPPCFSQNPVTFPGKDPHGGRRSLQTQWIPAFPAPVSGAASMAVTPRGHSVSPGV